MENSDQVRVPHEKLTPISVAGNTLGMAANIWIEISAKLQEIDPVIVKEFPDLFADPEAYFFAHIFSEMWDNPDSNGDKYADSLDEELGLLGVIQVVVAYAVQAMKTEKSGEHGVAWSYASDSKFWLGILIGTWEEKKNTNKAAVIMASKRHAENYRLASEAIEHWSKYINPSLSAQQAANELIKIVPLSHKKLAELVSKEKKKQHQ